jgi:Holliday junction resolvase
MSYNSLLHDLKVEELIDKYKQNGFDVERESKCNDVVFDLVAKKGDERIAFEVKVLGDKSKQNETIKKSRTVAENNGYKFILAIASRPQSNEIKIEDLNRSFIEYFKTKVPAELENLSIGNLSSKTTIEDISDIEIDNIHLLKDKNEIKGSALFELELDFRNNPNCKSLMYFDTPFKFEVVLDLNLKVERINKLEIDRSELWANGVSWDR